jgi:hypothetical protein
MLGAFLVFMFTLSLAYSHTCWRGQGKGKGLFINGWSALHQNSR